ncbi:hypothetical protein EV383_4013 [Pseudonocardia sediminis]|uniref:Minor structural protein GP20 n=1 Tax=Pseudonocardia sediminis TaxID=1397368 RepID=A0A4Q7UYT6_PSEST|nr:hypothetical protein [Pseudonocardia sediminis]RZT87106.1 hypothetical protein EV383_4013 [Pseudonocardia sediminis]
MGHSNDEVSVSDEEKKLAADYVAEQNEQEPAQAEKSGEAAKYRRRLREVEQERDGLVDQIAAMRRAEVDRIATSGDGPRLHDADDLDRLGIDRDSLIGEDGSVNASAVSQAIDDATSSKPYLRADLRRTPRGDPSQGHGGEGRPAAPPSWAGVVDLGTPQR